MNQPRFSKQTVARYLGEWAGTLMDRHGFTYDAALNQVKGSDAERREAFAEFRTLLLIMDHFDLGEVEW